MKLLGSVTQSKIVVTFALAVITTNLFNSAALAQSSSALDEIVTKYKACIKEELIASTNEDGSLDEVFFLEGKAHCDKINALQIDTARASQRIVASKARITQITDDLISGAKSKLGLQ